MGMHAARRQGGMTSTAGRTLFTATAAFALLGGGAGMAFAGEAPAASGHEASQGDHHGDCQIPVVDPTSEAVDGAVNNATHDATKPALEAGNEAIAPVHDAVCPPLNDVLGGVDAPTAPTTPELPSGLPV